MGYGQGRLRGATPDDKQPRAWRKGKRQVAAEIPIDLYARMDAACRRADVLVRPRDPAGTPHVAPRPTAPLTLDLSSLAACVTVRVWPSSWPTSGLPWC
jgi:hypothetical protein